jgi:hypothetical protein
MTGSWNEQLLGELFNNINVGCILQQIPLNNQGFEDFISWGLKACKLYGAIWLLSTIEASIWPKRK